MPMTSRAQIVAKLVEAGHLDLAEQLVDVVTAGIIKYPPQMYETILAWVKQMFGASVAEYAEDADIKAAALKLAGKKIPKKKLGSKSVTKKFKVDLRGLDASNYPVAQMTKVTDKIPVVLDLVFGHNRVRGVWTAYPASDRKLKLTIPMPYMDPKSPAEFVKRSNEFGPAIKHELQHMVQTFIEDSLDKAVFTQEKENKLEDIPRKEKYYLKPAEFHTWILSSKELLLESLLDSRPNDAQGLEDVHPTRKEFSEFVGNPRPGPNTSPFFTALHKHDRPRWKLAMREFYRIMAPLMDRK